MLAYVGKPPTRHNNGMSCWRYLVSAYVGKPPTRHTKMACCVVYVGKPPTRHTKMVCRVGGILCWRMSVNLQHDTPRWYVVLEVFCVGVCR